MHPSLPVIAKRLPEVACGESVQPVVARSSVPETHASYPLPVVAELPCSSVLPESSLHVV
jgi:hypothetical protein